MVDDLERMRVDESLELQLHFNREINILRRIFLKVCKKDTKEL